jgi:hypothetical protein
MRYRGASSKGLVVTMLSEKQIHTRKSMVLRFI